jgi:hypothetical protein
MGIELYPKFLSLAETRCYQPLCESIVAKCYQDMVLNFSGKPTLQELEMDGKALQVVISLWRKIIG